MDRKRRRSSGESSGEDLIVHENERDELKELLTSWGVEPLYVPFKNYGITINNLADIEESDYGFLMNVDHRMFGNIVTFRRHHREWKNKEKEDMQKVVVAKVLDCAEGMEIQNYFNENRKLNHDMRLKLGYLILRGRKVTRRAINDIADQIIGIFTGELKKYYYEKRRGLPATGVLISCLNALNGRTTAADVTDPELIASDNKEDVIPDDVQSSIEILNNEENHQNHALILEHWKATYNYRSRMSYKSAVEAFNAWPILKTSMGPYLMHIDFGNKYGAESADSMKNFQQFVSVNTKIFPNQIKNALVRRQLDEAVSNSNNHEIVMALFHMECLIPVSVSTKKSTWTPTIVDSRNAFCCTVVEFKDIQEKVDQRRTILQLKGMEEHPRIFYVSNQDEYFVQFRRIVYPAENFVDAMDSAFKIIGNYHIALPQDSSKIWHFLNVIFYKIKLPSEPTSELISKMSALKF